jgi:hypothetical protein
MVLRFTLADGTVLRVPLFFQFKSGDNVVFGEGLERLRVENMYRVKSGERGSTPEQLNLQRARLQAIIKEKFGGRYLGVLLTLKESQRILPIIDPITNDPKISDPNSKHPKYAIWPMPFDRPDQIAERLGVNVGAILTLLWPKKRASLFKFSAR